jgi:hypothetical protein
MSRSIEDPVDAEMVTWAYRLILGREPESQDVVEHHVRSHTTLGELRQSLIWCEEFRNERDGMKGAYEIGKGLKETTELMGTNTSVGFPSRADARNLQKGGAFFRGDHCNFWPRLQDFADGEFMEAYVLKGWMPEARMIDSRTRVTTFGSCFAVSIANHLSKLGYSIAKDRDPDIYISRMSEGLVNVHSILQQFEWALENKTPPENLWHGYDAEEYGYSEKIRERTRAAFLDTEFFVITFGLSEVWFDEPTGGVLWRGVPMKVYDPARHKFRMCSVAETRQKIDRIHAIIRRHVPKAKLLFTLSPIPLLATFRPVGCVTANTASKAILRTALDEFFRDHAGDLNRELFYFPSYEIANELFPVRFEIDCRHPRTEIVQFIMQTFEALYCESGLSMAEINALFRDWRLNNEKSFAATRR